MSTADARPFDALYRFVRKHLVVANHIVLAAITVAAAARCLVPHMEAAPRSIYLAAAVLLLTTALAAVVVMLRGPHHRAMGAAIDRLYAFVQDHLLVANNIVLASISLVAALEFLCPSVPLASQVVQVATALLLLAMLVAAAMPARIATRGRICRATAWQGVVALLAVVSVAGFVSVTRFGQEEAVRVVAPLTRTTR